MSHLVAKAQYAHRVVMGASGSFAAALPGILTYAVAGGIAAYGYAIGVQIAAIV